MDSIAVEQPGLLSVAVTQRDRPCVLRGLVSHWPLVQAARQGAEPAVQLLRSHWQGATIGMLRLPAAERGRIGYDAAGTALNFTREIRPFGDFLDELLACREHPDAPGLYMGSTTLQTCLPGLAPQHTLDIDAEEPPLVSLWLGNRVLVPAHQDWPSNLACCVLGRRRFTLFPPDAVADLYIGPVDFTPAGQAISLVNLEQPDLERHPRYASARARAQVVELQPGDALYLPSLWWHQVESLDAVSGLVNHWWRRSPPWSDSPVQALWLAMASVRDLPRSERDAWRALFDHYVFDADEHTAAHVPEAARGLLAPMDETRMRRLRAWLQQKLNR